MQPMATRVSIVEDDQRIRASLSLLVESSPGFCCLGAYGTGEEALKQIPGNLPEVVLMDINLPSMSGVDCVRQLKNLLPAIQVVMLTVYNDTDLIFQALRAGASGYLLKGVKPSKILEAIEEVKHGGAPMSSYIARKVVQSFQKPQPLSQPADNLSQRERQVLDYVAQGYINKEIADALAISLETVRSHLKSIYDKLHVRSRTEAVVKHLQ
jgi:DNA-binding NarL/FixJ family response regulator